MFSTLEHASHFTTMLAISPNFLAALGDPSADFYHDGSIDLFDFRDFTATFDAGRQDVASAFQRFPADVPLP